MTHPLPRTFETPCEPCAEFQRGERKDFELQYSGVTIHVCDHPAVHAMEPLLGDATSGCICGCPRGVGPDLEARGHSRLDPASIPLI